MSDVELPTRPTTTESAAVDRPGAVAGEGLEAGVALHYGDPMREQRLLEEGLASSTSRTATSSPSPAPTGSAGCTR